MDSKRVSPKVWWARLRTALERAARSARDWGHMAAVMCRQCQVDVLTARSAEAVAGLAHLSDAKAFETFRRACEREALYFVALAQAQRQSEKEARDNE